MSIFWKTEKAPTGRWRSFHHRGWPTGWSDRQQTHAVAAIHCLDEYTPTKARSGGHGRLSVFVAIVNANPRKEGAWSWRKLKGEWTTLPEAKTAAETFYNAHRDLFPGGNS